MFTIVVPKLFLAATAFAVVVSSSPIQSTKSDLLNSNSDLVAEYLLRDLLRSASNQQQNRQHHLKSYSNSHQRPWFAQNKNRYASMDASNDIAEHDDDQNRLISDLYTSLLLSSPTTTGTQDDYYQQQQPPLVAFDENQKELGWFDGPVFPKVTPIQNDENEVNAIDEVEGDVEQPTFDGNDEESALLNALWAKYFASPFNKNYNNEDDLAVDPTMLSGVFDTDIEQDYDDRTIEQMVDKRRQKVIKHEGLSKSKSETTTAKPGISSSTFKTTIDQQQQPHRPNQQTEKAKFLHKAATFNQSKQTKTTMNNGQKEYPMLRPASENKNQNQEWPSELDENTLAEEDSLKQLPKRRREQQQQQSSSRTVRDVLASQLDSLKMEKTDAKH